MNETTQSTTSNEQGKVDYKRAADTINGIVNEVMELGTTWVRYGLTVGESALRTSAQSLSGVANVLQKVADQVQARSAEKAAAEAPAEGAPPSSN